MINCPCCSKAYNTELQKCAACGFSPPAVDGFESWVEKKIWAKGFKPEYFLPLKKVESGHFWFESRNQLILWAIKKFFPRFNSLMEVGCGTGFVLKGIIRDFPEANFYGSELFTEGLKIASSRNPSAKFMQIDARQMPFIDEFDIVCAFDVLEHIEEDELVLKNLFQAIKPGGGLLLTIPQHQWLWSAADSYAGHARRYASNDIKKKTRDAGFEILLSTSFVTLLLPLLMISRYLSRDENNFNPSRELSINTKINYSLRQVLNFEILLITLGLNFPIGGSRFIVAKKI